MLFIDEPRRFERSEFAATSSHIAIMILCLFHQIELSMNSCSSFAELRKYADPFHVGGGAGSAGTRGGAMRSRSNGISSDREPNRWVGAEPARVCLMTAADLLRGGTLHRS